MDTDVVKAFNAELTSIYDSKPPLGKNKIQDISKAALKAKSYYKHVVFSLEKFLGKCKSEYKIPCLYVIDSIIRASKHQFKDKDVYAARFLKNFSKTLGDLLQCASNERPRVVRTLNLWGANGVYSEEAIAPFKQQCQEAGLETDLEKVEKLVKGGRADMSIYGGSYAKKDKDRRKSQQTSSKFEATTPPGPPPAAAAPETTTNGGFGKKEEPSTEVPEGGISEQHLLTIIQQAGCDFNGCFSSDLTLLRKAHEMVCNKLHVEENMRRERKKANIKNILKSDFNYSDDEDSGDEGAKQETEEEAYMPMVIEERLAVSDQMIRNPTVVDALKMIHQERIMQLNQVAIQAQQQNSIQAPPPHTAADLAAIQNAMGAVPSTIASGLPPRIPGLPPNLQLPPGLPLAALANLLPPNMAPPPGGNNPNALLAGLIGNPLNMPPLPHLVRQPGLMNLLGNGLPPDPELLKKQQAEILQQVYLGQPIGVPPPALPQGMGIPPPQLPPGFMPTGVPPPLPMNQSSEEDMRGGEATGEDRDKRKDRKRSRSRDRGDHKRSRRSRSRDRKPEKVDRERRKLGLPAVTPGVAIIASKTLWFGRLPANCSDKEIKAAITSAGDVTRVNIIQSKACGYITMDTRKNAYEVVNKLAKDLKVKDKVVKVSWAIGNGLKDEKYKNMFDSDKGVTLINWQMLPENLDQLCDGGHLDIESLPIEKQTCYTENGTIAIAVPNDDGSMDIASPSPNPPLNQGLNRGVAPNMFMMQHGINPALLHGVAPSQQHGLPPHMPPRMPPPLPSGHQIPVLGGMPPKHPVPPGTSHFPPQHHLPPGGHPMGSGGPPIVSPPKPVSAFDLAPSHFQGGRGGFRGGFRGGRGGFGGPEGRWGGDRPPRDGPPGGDFRRDGREFRGGHRGNFRGRGGGDFRGGPPGDFHRDGPPRGDFHDRRGGWERDEGRGGGRRNDDFGRRDSNGGRRDSGRDERRRSRWGDREEENWDRDGDRRDRRDEGRRDRDRRRSDRGSPPGEDQHIREREQPPMDLNQFNEPPPPGTDFTAEDAVVTSTTADIEPPSFQKGDHEGNNDFPPPGEDCPAPVVTILAEDRRDPAAEATAEC